MLVLWVLIWMHKRQGPWSMESTLIRKGKLLNYLGDMVGSYATIRQEIKIKKVRSISVWICHKLWFWQIHMDRNTYTIKSKCHKVSLRFMKIMVRRSIKYWFLEICTLVRMSIKYWFLEVQLISEYTLKLVRA